MGWLYLLTFPNGKLYVGLTSISIAARMRQHRYAAKNDNSLLYRAWRKHGAPTCSPLFEVPEDELPDNERALIRTLRTQTPHGYNSTEGGDVSPAKSPSVRAKLSAGRMGMKFTDEHKAALRAARAGQIQAPETNAKRGATLRAYHAARKSVART